MHSKFDLMSRGGALVGLALFGCSGSPASAVHDSVGETHEELLGNCNGSLSLSPASPGVPGDQVTLTGASTCQTGTPEYEFWVRPAGGDWTILCTWQSGTTCNWNTSGLPTGTYQFNLWTRAQGSTDPYEGSSGVPSYELVGTSGCISATLAASPPPPQFVGTSVTLSSSATCTSGLTPSYKFWAHAPGGGWTVACEWQLGATCPFVPNTEGDWTFQTWTRASGSGAGYEGFSPVVSYHAGGLGTCTSAALTVTPGFGTMVNLAGAATCSGTADPEFKYWKQSPTTGTWSVACDWKAGDCAWETAGLSPGQYGLQVWTRARGSSAGYEGYSPLQNYTVGTPTCSAVTFTGAVPASPSSAGTDVALSASSTCSDGGVAQYKTWLRPTAGAWSVLCEWSTNGTCNWANPAQGAYEFQVWERMIGSTAVDSWTPVLTHVIQ